MSTAECQRQQRALDPRHQLLASAKGRAKRDSVGFTIDVSDIIIPGVCPIYNIPLIPGSGKGPTNNSPTLDRINPTKGYTKGNVRVISHRANHKKQNNTIEDCELFIRYMKGLL